MEVWVVEWSSRDSGDTEITLWDNKLDAQRKAVRDISNYMNRSFDFDVDHDEACATDFNDMVSRHQYDDAIRRFHDHEDDYNSDYAQYWNVYKKSVLTGNGGIASGSGSSSTIIHSNGATCRGPCKQHNPYANADQSDGTYVCRQCKTFKHIFGANP